MTDFPHPVECHDPVWIPMDDGVELRARLWLPQGAELAPVPAILEYIPQRLRDEDDRLAPFAKSAPSITPTRLEPGHHNWYVHRDLAEDLSTLEVINDNGRIRLEDSGIEVATRSVETYRSRDDDFDSLAGTTLWERVLKRDVWEVRTVPRTVLTSTSGEFRLHATLEAYEGERRVYSRNWDLAIPPRLVYPLP